ncbi:hypothetical protein J6590_065041 [Homalodisca vitripennis]|nr:hypothetical protein J6590_065041 [Homalodisca vitripennis]
MADWSRCLGYFISICISHREFTRYTLQLPFVSLAPHSLSRLTIQHGHVTSARSRDKSLGVHMLHATTPLRVTGSPFIEPLDHTTRSRDLGA